MTKEEKRDMAQIKETGRELALQVKELWTYINSSKFHQDTTVQVQDIRNRLSVSNAARLEFLLADEVK